MKAKVDQEKCIGCEICVATCPKVFKMNDNGKAEVYVEVVPVEEEKNCRDAQDDCPADAISIEE